MAIKIRSIDFIFCKNKFATDIKAARTELGYTLDDVAKETIISDAQLGKYENALEDNPKMQHFLNICNVYDLNPHDYFELAN